MKRPPLSRYFTIMGTRYTPLILGPCATELEIIDYARMSDPSISNFNAALRFLNKGDKVFEIYDVAQEALIFLNRAEALGLEKEAEFLTRQTIIKERPCE